jgi:hypothetical protein
MAEKTRLWQGMVREQDETGQKSQKPTRQVSWRVHFHSKREKKYSN